MSFSMRMPGQRLTLPQRARDLVGGFTSLTYALADFAADATKIATF